MELPTRACWRAEEVASIISNEALEGHEGIFLATHTPITDFQVAGSHAGEIEGRDEAALLNVLAADTRRHAFCVVQGEPGSGKSHLIRWLSINWPQGNDIKLLLQRSDGSLEGALRQMRDRLPPEFQDLFDKLGRRHRATDQGRANMLLSNLANALHPDHFDPPLEDAEWCRTNRPGELIDHPAVKRAWQGPTRILQLMEGKGGDGAQRNSQSATFDVFDIEDLSRSCAAIHGTGVYRATERLSNRLQSEANIIEELRGAGWTAAEIESENAHQIPNTMKLVEALNRRRNDAVQNLLGVSAEGLKDLFRQIRTALASRRQRLVLLLEDITSWEGIDDSLIDVLVTNAETRGADGDIDMCPLISVVGVTPAYYKNLHGNYRGRITHEVNLGAAQQEGELQDVATLRHRESRVAFAARYLSAVRAGAENLNDWRQRRRADPDLETPNRCTHCEVREGCHEAFGSFADVGLYPFTEKALDNFFEALNDRDNGMTWKTPRGVLQAVLGPNLMHAKAIEGGTFPTAFLENNALVPESRTLGARLSNILDTKLSDQPADLARMRRVIAYWGDRERADTLQIANGELAFAGVPRSVFSAFTLPWVGDDEGVSGAVSAPPTDPNPVVLVREPVTADSDRSQPTVSRPQPSRPRIAAPPSAKRVLAKTDLQTYRDQLRQWSETGEPQAPMTYNRMLFDLLGRIDPRSINLDQHSFRRLLTEQQVKIEGTGPSVRSYLIVPREEWLWKGLEGFIALQLDKEMSLNDAAFHRGALATMLRRLESLFSDYADRRLSKGDDGLRWSPIPVFVQVLLARAWLRGTTAPDQPLPQQLQAILSDESEAESDPNVRSVPWREYLNKSNPHHKALRNALREMLGTPQGEARGFGLADVSLVVGPMYRLKTTLRFDPLPQDLTDVGVNELDTAREIVKGLNESLGRVVRTEREQLEQRGSSLKGLLRGRTIRDHFLRIDNIVSLVSTQMPSASPDAVRQWKLEFERAQGRLVAGSDRITEDFLLDVAELLEDGKILSLAAAARAPARELYGFLEAAKIAEQVIASLLEHVRDCVAQGTGTASLGDIHNAGRTLAALVKVDEAETA
jgi:hypothetical protein